MKQNKPDCANSNIPQDLQDVSNADLIWFQQELIPGIRSWLTGGVDDLRKKHGKAYDEGMTPILTEGLIPELTGYAQREFSKAFHKNITAKWSTKTRKKCRDDFEEHIVAELRILMLKVLIDGVAEKTGSDITSDDFEITVLNKK